MNTLKPIVLFVLLFISIAAGGQTQAAATARAKADYQKANEELAGVCKLILQRHRSDSVFLEHFKMSQTAWEQFRTIELKMKYPPREPGYYGSIHSMCLNDYLTELTRERIAKLRIWIDGIEEGDACAGSIPPKE